ncbi:hypothetical protein [uncultured Winogradskyella sp.]|uniref:hypothetical protein n=1 Tax=uncultured Winogradskyella sp. TaxID=395353 RepID=UPI0030D894B9|tara:strand:- start:4708 stop:5304 length:597 start_codon:yes stop_codon:yes gene_type:complete
MKNQLIGVVFVIGLCLSSFAQENEEMYLLESDNTWLKEIIKFPFGFAQDIDFEGYEDLRFAKDWSKPNSSEFFTYAFVWNINLKKIPTIDIVTSNIKLYYDGLMAAVNKDSEFTVPKTIVKFSLNKKKSELPGFRGVMQIYDSFFTEKVIDLYVTVVTLYCETRKDYLLFFKVSSKSYENEVWKKLNTVKLKANYCKR